MVNDRGWAGAALDRALHSVGSRLDLDGYPHVTENGRWVLSDDGFWTGGFWIGLLWAGYEERRDERFREAADRLLATFVERAGETQNHDLGMMFYPSAVKGYELTGERRYRDAALLAAESLASQFNERGNFLPGWGFFGGDEWEGSTLVDTLMNLPLLIWAADETGDERLRDVALAHGRTSLAHHLRPDGSTFHVYVFDPITGKPQHGDTYQGKRADSCWSRGLAWTITGCAQLALMGAGTEFREAAERAAAWYVEHLPEDRIPYWDFEAESWEPRDASAGAIAAFGLLLLERQHDGERCLRALVDHAQAPQGHKSILLHATADLPHGIGIDGSTIYGDYFFVRALQELRDRISATADAGALQTQGGS
jgi:unsaturated chondroitin disaccharide hydrolase